MDGRVKPDHDDVRSLRFSSTVHTASTSSGRLWFVMGLLVALAVMVPVAALGFEALGGSMALWQHLAAYVLPQALIETLILLCGVGLVVMVVGTGAAWLVTAYEFPGRRVLEWALLLPLAVPTYIIAYAYLDLLHPLGPVQGVIRAILGYDSPRQFRLPDIRSMAGCILLLGFVLYPYVYITTRAMFMTQAANLVEAARMLGVSRSGIFFRIALPLARPAIAVGVSLALMETLNDIGASEFLGVRTLTISVYTTWVTRSDLAGAAQIALAMLMIVVAVVAVERLARRRQRYFSAARQARRFAPLPLSRGAGFAALGFGLVPVVIGFAAPATYLAVEAAKRIETNGLSMRLMGELGHTLGLAAAATIVVLVLGTAVAYMARALPGSLTQLLMRLSTLGYAMPGTVVALGVLIPLATLDGMIDRQAQAFFGVSTGLLLIGSGAALIFAYAVRFMAIAAGSAETGFARIPTSLDQAARSLGRDVNGTFFAICLPLSRPALAAAGLLVFVDCMKELPATLLLRPLNVETLATHLYAEAARGTYEEAAVAALAIVLAGLLPVILLARIGRR